MLVDNGKVGPATQLLTMPSSAADEFSGLFRLLVEHEMLPQHTAAHPEYVSMLFGSSGCSSGSTVRSYSSFLSLNGGSAAAGAAAGRKSPQRTATAAAAATSVGAGGPTPLPGIDSTFLQQQLLLQGQHRRRQKHKPRRHSAGYVQVSGSPAVVRQWSTGSPSVGADGGVQGAAASGSSGGRARKAAAAAEGSPRLRRASDGEAFVHSASMLETVSVEGSSGGTLTTIEASVSTSNHVSDRLPMLTPGPDAVEQQPVLGCAGAGAAQAQRGAQPQQQLQAQVHSGLLSGRLSTLSSGDLPRFGVWEAAVAGDARAAGLLLIGDGDDAEELHADQAAAVAGAAAASSTAGPAAAAAGAQATTEQQHRGLQAEPADLQQQQEGRKSLSLDRCAVHVHNEVERAQRTRTRMSIDEGVRNRMSLDESIRAGGSGGTLQLGAAPDAAAAAASGPAGAAAVSLAAISSSALFTATGYPGVAGNSSDPAVLAAAAAEAAARMQQGPAPTVSVAAPLGGAGAAAAASAASGADATSAGQPAAAAGPATAAVADGGQAAPDALQQQGVSNVAEAAVAHMLVGSRGLERRTAAEANMSAAFTTAWTCHMLELASDLQVR
jgi:hypothetical protein